MGKKGAGCGGCLTLVVVLLLLGAALQIWEGILPKRSPKQATQPAPPKACEIIGQSKGVSYWVFCRKGTDEKTIRQFGKRTCPVGKACVVFFWDRRHLTPTKLPITDEQTETRTHAWFAKSGELCNKEGVCSK